MLTEAYETSHLYLLTRLLLQTIMKNVATKIVR